MNTSALAHGALPQVASILFFVPACRAYCRQRSFGLLLLVLGCGIAALLAVSSVVTLCGGPSLVAEVAARVPHRALRHGIGYEALRRRRRAYLPAVPRRRPERADPPVARARPYSGCGHRPPALRRRDIATTTYPPARNAAAIRPQVTTIRGVPCFVGSRMP